MSSTYIQFPTDGPALNPKVTRISATDFQVNESGLYRVYFRFCIQNDQYRNWDRVFFLYQDALPVQQSFVQTGGMTNFYSFVLVESECLANLSLSRILHVKPAGGGGTLGDVMRFRSAYWEVQKIGE
jgi:hypothetical protein